LQIATSAIKKLAIFIHSPAPEEFSWEADAKIIRGKKKSNRHIIVLIVFLKSPIQSILHAVFKKIVRIKIFWLINP
jgi:hypothetical protein